MRKLQEVKKYTTSKRVTIGKLSKADPEMIQPNENFLRFFPDAPLPEEKRGLPEAAACRSEHFLLSASS